jgi:choline dehydrogenase-like flavoprotein
MCHRWYCRPRHREPTNRRPSFFRSCLGRGRVVSCQLSPQKKILNTSIRSNQGATDTIIPFFCPRASPLTQFDWNYTTTPQSALNGRTVAYARGHVLGGSSSISTRRTVTHHSPLYLLSICPQIIWLTHVDRRMTSIVLLKSLGTTVGHGPICRSISGEYAGPLLFRV